MSKKITITAGGNFGSTSAEYSLDSNGTLHIVERGDTMNLQGNHIANSFDGQQLESINFDELSAKYRHNAERCGCHMCGFSVGAAG